MADDQSQKPYRASEPPVRGPAKAAGSDPLAELARLIGQTDPFGEFGRDPARRTAQAGDRFDWNTQPSRAPHAPQISADPGAAGTLQSPEDNGYHTARLAGDERQGTAKQSYDGPSYGRQSHGGTPSTTGGDYYQADHETHGYPPSQADYQHDAYEHNTAQHVEDEYYDDEPPARRRLGIMAIAGVFALAVIGTAGAFGYRALFGSSGSSQPPPVIKADTGPSKIVPATPGKETQSSKLITDRVSERGQSEKLVSREEQPIDKPATVVLSQTAPQSPMGSGVVASEPKKIRTIAIRPDQTVMADATPPSAVPLAAAAPARATPTATPTTKPSALPQRAAADSTTADAEQDTSLPGAARSAPPVRQPAPASSNVPLSLSPDAQPARAAPAPARTASVAATAQPPAPPAASNSGAIGAGSYVQISSQRSEAEAQAAFRSLQAKYPSQLGGRQPLIHKVELGTKGTYYRAMVGPFANASEAGDLCASLKAAGGQCLIQRN